MSTLLFFQNLEPYNILGSVIRPLTGIMDMNKSQVMAMLNCSLDENLNYKAETNMPYNGTTGGSGDSLKAFGGSSYGYWQDLYYPTVIKESYPVYLQERSLDKGKQAFEIIKVLKDKKVIKLNKVGDFIDLMDELIKIL